VVWNVLRTCKEAQANLKILSVIDCARDSARRSIVFHVNGLRCSTVLLDRRSLRFAHVPLEVTMELFIHEQKLAHYRRLLAESERDPARNEVQHNWLLKLLANEEAADTKPLDHRH
jgi:hypothetical protein